VFPGIDDKSRVRIAADPEGVRDNEEDVDDALISVLISCRSSPDNVKGERRCSSMNKAEAFRLLE